MLLFRSEEHVDRWCAQWHQPKGGLMSLDTCTKLAFDWYHDRLDPNGRRKTPEEAKAIFTNLGLTDPFWKLN